MPTAIRGNPIRVAFFMKKIIYCLIIIIFIFTPFSKAEAVAPVGNYLELNGGFVLANLPSGNSPTHLTIEASVKPTSLDGIQKIISIGEKSKNLLHYEVGINGGFLSLTFRHGQNSLRLITAGQLKANEWQQIKVLIYPSKTALYIDNNEKFSTNGASDLLTLADTLTVGTGFSQQGSDPEKFIGAVDEIRITDSNLVYSITTFPPPPPPSPFLLWHLDESRGETIAYDSSGNNFHGNLIGGDNKIHFFGILPSPTPKTFAFPTLRWTLPQLPRLQLPTITFPQPTISNPFTSPQSRQQADEGGQPTPPTGGYFYLLRDSRPVLPR